jgi:hypothetical protein
MVSAGTLQIVYAAAYTIKGLDTHGQWIAFGLQHTACCGIRGSASSVLTSVTSDGHRLYLVSPHCPARTDDVAFSV